jgi:folate-binding protein YgfZ
LSKNKAQAVTVPVERCLLSDFGVLAARGAGGSAFLQGQLSNDLARLTAHVSLLAGLHNPQGRALAVLRLVRTAPEEILAVLPREIVEATVARLRKFVLRAKVAISDESAAFQVVGIAGSDTARADARRALGAIAVLHLEVGAQRELALAPAAGARQVSGAAILPRAAWRALDIAAGLPQVYAATSEAFVAQMLNLDVLGGIAFDKGCYTGQEIIARAHYRGRIKRRMQRFLSRHPVALSAGAAGKFTDGRAFTVVEAMQREDGRCEFLAVTNLPGLTEPRPEGEVQQAPGSAASAALECDSLTLPYALPA